MIQGFSLANAYLFGDALASQARLRHRVFVEDRGLDHRHYDGMEYDEFDTPAAVYLVWREGGGPVRGLIRLLPTTLPYMLQTYWPHLVEGALPSSERVWEITRVCVDRRCPPRMRARIMPELMCAVHEYSVQNEIDAVIGVARPKLVSMLVRKGIRWLGPLAEVEGAMERAFWIAQAYMRPTHYCARFGLEGSVLMTEPTNIEKVAA